MNDALDDFEQVDFRLSTTSDQSTTGAQPASLRPSQPQPWNYEQSVTQIEAVIHRIEAGELELAEVFEQFAIAVEHLRHCETFLTHQKQHMDLLIETLLDEEEF
jgi:exodeoxyribonuclease VII small subunit